MSTSIIPTLNGYVLIEASLVDHMNVIVIIGYPTVSALIISVTYVVSANIKSKFDCVIE